MLRKFAACFKGAQVSVAGIGAGLNVDLTSLLDHGAREVETAKTMNALLRGDYGVEGVKYGLQLIFDGMVKVRNGKTFSYVPRHAYHEDGVVLSAFLPHEIMSQAAYFLCDGEVFWVPGKGRNVFKVQSNPRRKIVTLLEKEQHVSVEEAQRWQIVYPVG